MTFDNDCSKKKHRVSIRCFLCDQFSSLFLITFKAAALLKKSQTFKELKVCTESVKVLHNEHTESSNH